MSVKYVDRKFTDWTYESETGKVYSLEIRYKQPNEGAEFKFTFYCIHSMLPKFRVENSDLEQLRLRIVDMLESEDRIEWHKKLCIVIDGVAEEPQLRRLTFRELRAPIKDGINLFVLPFEEGKTKDGRVYHRFDSQRRGDDDLGLPQRFRIEEGPFLDPKKDKTFAQANNERGIGIVDDTPEMRKKLKEVRDGLENMRVRIAKLVNSNNVQKKILATTLKALP